MDPTNSAIGNVLKQNTGDCSDVVLGNWSLTNNCPDSVTGTSSFCAGGLVNAIKVTTRMSATNGNSLALIFASMVGWSNINVSATAIATYGNTPGAVPWNVGLVQDVSGSFALEIGNAKAADQTLANCMLNSPGAELGISVFGVTSKTPFENGQAIAVSGNIAAITADINNISVGGNNMPSPNGTDIAAGINSAVNQICPNSTCSPPPSSFKPTIVLLTDGQPNTCNGVFGSCTVAQAQANAVTAANNAAALGFDVYAIYYCNEGTATCNDQTSQQAAAFLQTLVRGNGKFAKTPTASQFSQLMASSVCKNQLQARLVW